MPSSERRDANWACRRYEEIRPRLPSASFPATSRRIANLGDLTDEIDVFVLDGFGVLNVGASVVPGAPERMAALRAAGKSLFVLTNGASYPTEQSVAKYRRLGFDFNRDEVISSRDALATALSVRRGVCWGFAAKAESAIGELTPDGLRLGDDRAGYDSVDGFVLLSAGDWNRDRQEMLVASLNARPRPVLVGNPDLVAPREDGLSIEPGFYAHELADRTGCVPEFFGKPFANAFELVRQRIGPGLPGHSIAMVGDTLHTDILGGAAMGWRTVLVIDHGLVRGFDAKALDRLSDIRPDFIADTT
jgi:HAD superfamily hydrolase (TIGR01450 family)